MKKYILFLLVLTLLLTGCHREEPGESTLPSTEATQATQGTSTTLGPDRYQENSTLETGTNGAVRLYDTAALGSTGIVCTEQGVVLFSPGKLTLLSGENLRQEASARLPEEIVPGSPYFVWGEDGVAYFDTAVGAYVLLNYNLQQTGKLEIPAGALGIPVLSKDLQTMYYATETAIRAMDIPSGVSRLLRQGESAQRQVEGLLFDGHTLLYSQKGKYLLISTENGQTLFEGDRLPLVATDARMYFRAKQDYILELTLGTWDADPQTFTPAADMEDMAVNLKAMAAVSRTGQSLHWYDLSLGLRSARVELPAGTVVVKMAVDAGGDVWFLDGDGNLACWDTGASQLQEPQACLTPGYSRDNPDTEGLEQLQLQADAMGEKYGVKILLDISDVKYQRYAFVAEYRVAAFKKGMAALDSALQRLPEDLLGRLGDVTIALAADVQGPTDAAVQFWQGGQPVLVLERGETMELELYRQIYLVMDSWIITASKLLDDWVSLNPRGARYDYDYAANQLRQDLSTLEGDDPAFLDKFSMSYPREDRATIFAYAMTDLGAGRFETDTLQAKLTRLCEAIRTGLNLRADNYPWEQYLVK